MSEINVAITDYGLGNLFSVKQACEQAGMQGNITADPEAVLKSDAIILPGVGAFGDAMTALHHRHLAEAIQEFVATGKPLFGICLGMQLVMDESLEFGHHEGLKLIEGSVVPFENLGEVEGLPEDSLPRRYKVPQVGWNQVCPLTAWDNTLLENMPEGALMYFVHSYYVKPKDASVELSYSRYGTVTFCSSLRKGNVFACQFHPERSGPQGIQIYQNIAMQIRTL